MGAWMQYAKSLNQILDASILVEGIQDQEQCAQGEVSEELTSEEAEPPAPKC